ncbi:MAG: ORF6N domain-containing protein [Planctomycetes bacterium]|nr:ORF6N domain-containing protein [Planctomycetota bacterium]
MARQRKPTSIIPVERIDHSILLIRGHKVMLDRDLASLYQVEVRALIQAVKRNRTRFPEDFMFQLTRAEAASLRSHSVIIKRGRGSHSKYLPHVFTEQGVAMLSSVLRSQRAVRVNIEIMRAFVRLRQLLSSNAELARKLKTLERKYDAKFRVVFEAIRELMVPQDEPDRPPIGFHSEA